MGPVPFGRHLLSMTVEEIEESYRGTTPPEAIRMYLAIARGSKMESGEGWFGPSKSRFENDWLFHCHGTTSITQGDFLGRGDWFDRLDRNRDGTITPEDFDWSEKNPWVQHAYMANRLFRKLDLDGDGILTRSEWFQFFEEAAGTSGGLRSDELRDRWLSGMTASFLPGDAPTRETLLKGLFEGEIGSPHEGPSPGELAPDFQLATIEGKQVPVRGNSTELRLRDCLGTKPIVLVFGNFTCGPFRSMYPEVDAIAQRHQESALFLGVYVKEAHPSDGWSMDSNARVGIQLPQPKSLEERTSVAQQCARLLRPSIPLLIDDMQDSTGHAYSGMPARLYVLDRNGRVTYKGGRGPFGFKPGEMEQALIQTLLEQELAPPLSPLSQEECWKVLPRAIQGSGSPLPTWARLLARELPRTAAALLEVDLAQRTKSPLDPILRAELRWYVARTNRSKEAEEIALADLKRAGGEPSNLLNESGSLITVPSPGNFSYPEAMELVRLLTISASKIPDELFERVRSRLGDKQVAALVLLAAYANFQDRLLLGLRVTETLDPPALIQFDEGAFQMAPFVPATGVYEIPDQGEQVVEIDASWDRISFEELQSRLDQQKHRSPRLPIPTWEEVKTKIPPSMAARPTRVIWNLVCSGYVPELAVPWSIATRTMWAEAQVDRILEESLFWVQTRAVECNYCMGHCEMLLGVAGLNEQGIRERTQALASTDWSRFPPAEQRAYAYARKLSQTPWRLTPTDYLQLVSDWGPKTAMAIFFWLCRGLYMTRVSDGFQLPLEQENVFQNLSSTTPKSRE